MYKLTFNKRQVEDIKKYLKRYPEKSVIELDKAIDKSITIVQGQSRIEAPIITGYLRRRIEKEPIKPLKAEVVSRAEYGYIVHEGGRNRRGNPYMERAIRKQTTRMVQYFRQALVNIIKH